MYIAPLEGPIHVKGRGWLCLKTETADLPGGRWNAPEKPSKPPAQWYCLQPQLQQDMNGFFFLGNVL